MMMMMMAITDRVGFEVLEVPLVQLPHVGDAVEPAPRLLLRYKQTSAIISYVIMYIILQ